MFKTVDVNLYLTFLCPCDFMKDPNHILHLDHYEASMRYYMGSAQNNTWYIISISQTLIVSIIVVVAIIVVICHNLHFLKDVETVFAGISPKCHQKLNLLQVTNLM